MPTYEYLCRACDHEFERVQRITEDPVKTCPSCKKRKVERLISQTSFVLKGGGWYNDLYASKKGDSGKDGAVKDDADKSGATAEAKSKDGNDAKDSKDPKDSKPDSKKGSKDESSKGGKKSKGSKAAA